MKTTAIPALVRLFASLAVFALAQAAPLSAGTPHAHPPYFDLQFASLAGQPGQLSFSYGPIYAGRTYTPEFCTNLAAGDWQPLTTTSASVDAAGRRTVVDLAANGPRKFYRVRLAGDPTPFQLTVENHWVANSGGRRTVFAPEGADLVAYNGNAGTHITGIHVFQDQWTTNWQPWVITTNEWDETGLGNAPNLGAAYLNGVCIGKNSSGLPAFDSRVATNTAGTLTASVKNYHGRFFFLKVGLPDPFSPTTFPVLRLAPPPTGAAAPYIELSDGRTIRSIEDPTAVSFDLQGRLWITDNGPDQNVKIFSVAGTAAPALVETFGETGGVYAGPVPGAWGEKRFWGPIGVAHDTLGNFYIGCTGMSSLMMGGTDIRAYDPTGKFLWKVNGHFMTTADADPASDGTSIFTPAKRFVVDYAKPPGASWSFAAVTLDPFRYPQDVRLMLAASTSWVRYIEGKKFLFCTDIGGGFIYVVRFEPGSEIGIPTAFFWLGSNGLNSDTMLPVQLFPGLQPVWDFLAPVNSNRRWRWLDKNGNGRAEEGEFDEFSVGCQLGTCVDVDSSGTIWFGGLGSYAAGTGNGGMVKLVPGGLDWEGVPRYPLGAFERPSVPYPECNGLALRLKYLAASDTMFFSASANPWYDQSIYRYDHFSDPARRIRSAVINLGYDDLGREVHLDQGTADMTIPHGFTADEDYVYVVYMDNGRDARVRGEVTIYDAHDGHKVGWIVPGDETGHNSGAMDLVNPINVTTRANGEKIIMVEDNGGGKVMVYRWTPPHMP